MADDRSDLSRNPDAVSDADLLARGVGGDDAAFTQLMRRHEDRIFALALRMTGTRSDALDATQDAFVAVFRKGHTFSGDSAFSTWLYRVAINACKDLLRKKARLPVPEADLPERDRPGAPSIEDTVASRLDLRSALAGLPDEYREAVAMHDLGGVPYEEIARVTGAALGTVKSRISRGRKQLAILLEQAATERPSKQVGRQTQEEANEA